MIYAVAVITTESESDHMNASKHSFISDESEYAAASSVSNGRARHSSYHSRWSTADDERLLSLVNSFTQSTRIWKDVASCMNRTAIQCRTRWNYKFNGSRKRRRPSSDMDTSDTTGSSKSCASSVFSYEENEDIKFQKSPKNIATEKPSIYSLTDDELLDVYFLVN